MKSTNFFEHFYNLPAGDKLVRDVTHEINPDIWGKKCLVFGYGEKYLDNLEATEMYYACPNADEIYHWPQIRPFKTIVADGAALPFLPNTWDAVIMIHHIEFAKNCMSILKEMHRVLKPSGKLIIIAANRPDFSNKDMKAFSMGDITSGLLESSFGISKIVGVNRKLNFWPYRFSYTLNKYNELVMNIFPFLSDIVIIFSEKTNKAVEVVSSLKEQYEIS